MNIIAGNERVKETDFKQGSKKAGGKTPAPELKEKKILYFLKKDYQLYLLLALPILFYIIFRYASLYGTVVAFQDYNIFKGVLGSKWVGLEVFKEIFSSNSFYRALRNTFFLNTLELLFSFPAPILIAILLTEINLKWFKRVSQTIIYLPHFLSWVIVGGLFYQLFATKTGLINGVLSSLELAEGLPFLTDKWLWLVVYIFSGIWHDAGWGAIIYIAAISSINGELYEASAMDGAGRLRRIWHVTLPGIQPTIVIMLILSVGRLASSGFERPFIIGNNMVLDFSDVIGTYVYRVGLQSLRYNIATAVGLFQCMISMIFIVSANKIAKRFGEEGIW